MTLMKGGHPIMDWMSTLDRMVANGTRVRFSCNACGGWRDVPLEDLVARYGPAGSLWDETPACTVEGCAGRGIFLASPGPSTPFRPLLSASQASRKLNRPAPHSDR